MKKFIMLLLVVALSTTVFAQENFTESVAGTIKVSKEKVGVLWVDPQSYTWPLTWMIRPLKTVMPGDSFFTFGIKSEIIRRGGEVMVINPPGMEKIISPFIVMNKGQQDVNEEVAGNLPSIVKNFTGPEGLSLIKEMSAITEFYNEANRVDQFAASYKKVLDLWGVTKLITIESTGMTNCIVRGYNISSASASLVFQYYLKTDAAGLVANYGKESRVEKDGYKMTENEKIKKEQSEIRTYEVIKKISSFFN